MIFTEFRFLFFFLIVFSIYWVLNKNKHRKLWLLGCSYLFYGAWDWRFLSLMLVSTVVDYVAGLSIFRAKNLHQRKKWLLVSLVCNLGILGFFKYYNFFTESTSNFFSFLGLPISLSTLTIILPVGISFYTFQTLSYSIDIYRGKLKPTRNFFDFALFVSFFPQLVAGPIVRAKIFLPQLLTVKVFSQVDVRGCLILFLVGYFKKACVSDNISPLVNQYFTNPENFTATSAWIATITFVIQIYCDFSGYSDMAIASAGLLGYQLPLNFKFPYFASSITEFWQRWHITMSGWFRDYVYVPLCQTRTKKQRTQIFIFRNLTIMMLLSGLWHGAAWHYVVWGGLHGIALFVHKQWSAMLSAYKNLLPIRKIIGIPLTFYWFCASAVFFVCPDLKSSWIAFKSFVWWDSPGVRNIALQAGWIFIPLVLLHWLAYKGYFARWWRNISTPNFVIFYALLVASILPFIAKVTEPFIYFQF